MIFWYKNSILASIVSIFGCGLAMCGIALLSSEPGGAIAILAIGVALAWWGRQISGNKEFKKWWKQVEDKKLEPAIASDLNVAITIYQKNPQNRTLKKIESLNPAFAEHIRQNIVNKK